MSIADKSKYLLDLSMELKKEWPDNRTINIVCFGHSVPAGYFATPYVNTFNAYPYLLHRRLKERYPYAVINVIVSAIGGENSLSGVKRFRKDALTFHPDLITIDYGLNDRGNSLEDNYDAWVQMVDMAVEENVKVLLLTPSLDNSFLYSENEKEADLLRAQAKQIIRIANEKSVGLADVFKTYERLCSKERELQNLLAWPNHPNREGHDIIAAEIMKWFPVI